MTSQLMILHLRTEMALLAPVALQPGHLFFSLKYAMQMPQSIPQGAMSEVLFNDPMLLSTFSLLMRARLCHFREQSRRRQPS
jgi:hypothetical protein